MFKRFFVVALFRELRHLLEKCAATSLSSKLVSLQKDFFAKMVVDAVMSLDDLLPLSMIGIKKVSGGALEVRIITRSSPDQSIAFGLCIIFLCLCLLGFPTGYWCGFQENL